ncbi:MAG: hypothetical protein ACRETU_04625, partial [Steroidobacterales bacterium]
AAAIKPFALFMSRVPFFVKVPRDPQACCVPDIPAGAQAAVRPEFLMTSERGGATTRKCNRHHLGSRRPGGCTEFARQDFGT